MVRALFAVVVAALFVLAPAPAQATKVHGAIVLDESRKIDEDRYESQRDWDRTLQFFRSVYGRTKGVVWRRVDAPPGVNAIHLANTSPDRTWEGMNIYETQGKVYIYVLAARPKGNDAAKKKK